MLCDSKKIIREWINGGHLDTIQHFLFLIKFIKVKRNVPEGKYRGLDFQYVILGSEG